MKIKRFNNLWTMGLILFGAILVLFYIAKIFFPEWVVGVAEIPSIVAFGNFVDRNKWAYYLFNGFISFIALFFYTCSCCRIKCLKWKEVVILILLIVISHLIEEFLFSQLVAYNFVLYALLPLLVVSLRKIKDYRVFYSTVICFIITTIAQSLSLFIRDIPLLVSCQNTATYFVLLIDGYIWTILLYNFYNYNGGVKNG